MGAKSVDRRIRLRNGTEFNVTFHQRSSSLVVVEAKIAPQCACGRNRLHSRFEVFGAQWMGRVRRFITPIQPRHLMLCVRHSWNSAVDRRLTAK